MSIRSSGRVWNAIGVAAVTAMAVLLVLYFVLPAKKATPAGSLTATEQAATVAAGTIAVDLVSYTRKNFNADFARALAATTGSLHADQSQLKSQVLKTMTDGKFDLYGKVRHAAFVTSDRKGSATDYVVLVALYGYTTNTPGTPNPQNLQVTLEQVKGRWLASDATSVGIS